MSPVVAGVDGGGTGCRVVLVDESGRELGRTEGPAGAIDPQAPEVAARTVVAAVREAIRSAGVQEPLAGLWAGLAGAGRDDVRRRVHDLLQASGVAERVAVGTDAQAAFHDAFGHGPGILLVAGTGSVAWARDPRGREHRVGGWGPILGDQGGGYALAGEALRRIALAADGRGPETVLGEVLLAALGLHSAAELIPWVAGASRGEIAALAPRVVEAAQGGDAVAREVVDESVDALAGLVHALAGLPGFGESPRSVALTGGLLRPGGPLRGAVARGVAGPRMRILDEAVDPPRGAARLARALLT